MALPPYVGTLGRTWHYGFHTYCGLVFVFLVAPLIAIIPLSFNAEPYFTFSKEMVNTVINKITKKYIHWKDCFYH